MISKIRHQTCQISDFHIECYMGGGGGSDFKYGLINDKQNFMQLILGRN